MERKYSRYQKLASKMDSKLSSLYENKDYLSLKEQITKGQNKYLRMVKTESSVFDSTWVDAIEDCLLDIGDIVKNPRKITKIDPILVPVELAKKINSMSVQHLASHTQYVKEITPEGDVIPSKILSIENDDDYMLYENRFVATLIKRLVLFIEKRYEFITRYAPLKDTEVLKMKSVSSIDGGTVEINTEVKVTRAAEYQGVVEDNEYIKRVNNLRTYMRFYYGSSFMKMFKNEKDVRNPIIMTNIIRKNPKYNHCYKLFRFIEGYNGLGITYGIKTEFAQFSEEEISQANDILLANFLALKGRDPSTFDMPIVKKNKPVIVDSIDDEMFTYSDVLELKKIEFVRVDEDYRKAMEQTVELPTQMKKQEEEFHSEERNENREKRQERVEKNKLLSRKNKEVQKFNKIVERIVKEREEERLRKIKEEQERQERERQARIEAARKELKNKAISDSNEQEKLLEEARRIIEEEMQNEALQNSNDEEERISKLELDPNLIRDDFNDDEEFLTINNKENKD